MNNAPQESVSILRTIWAKNGGGRWGIVDLQGLDLNPQDGFQQDYFKIRPEIFQRPGLGGGRILLSLGTTEYLARQSIVPVVAWNEGDKEMRCIGTGFFISASGLLLTAGHVLRDPVDEGYGKLVDVDANQKLFNKELRFGILLPPNPALRNAPFDIPDHLRFAKWFVCPFEWMRHWGKEVESPLLHQKPQFKFDIDIAVCKVSQHPVIGAFQPLNIGLHTLRTGDRAVAIGYAEMENLRIDAREPQLPELIVSVGAVTNVFPNNATEKQNPTPGPNFEFAAKIPGKMSGAPILVGSGMLTKGVVSRSWQGENYASGCLVAAAMGLPLVHNRSILDMMKAGEEGIAQISGRDL